LHLSAVEQTAAMSIAGVLAMDIPVVNTPVESVPAIDVPAILISGVSIAGIPLHRIKLKSQRHMGDGGSGSGHGRRGGHGGGGGCGRGETSSNCLLVASYFIQLSVPLATVSHAARPVESTKLVSRQSAIQGVPQPPESLLFGPL